MITLTRVTASGMQGHVDYKISTGRLLIVPSEIKAMSELSTDRYGIYKNVTSIQVDNETYHVIEDFDTVVELINS